MLIVSGQGWFVPALCDVSPHPYSRGWITQAAAKPGSGRGGDKSSTPESFCCILQTCLGSKQENPPAVPAWRVPKAHRQGSKGLWEMIFLRVANILEPAEQENVQN